jgi:hypothetical protein
VHSATLDSGDETPPCGLAGLRGAGCGWACRRQARGRLAVRRALAVTADGEPLFTSFQSLERPGALRRVGAGRAADAGARVIVKEAVAAWPRWGRLPGAHRVAGSRQAGTTTTRWRSRQLAQLGLACAVGRGGPRAGGEQRLGRRSHAARAVAAELADLAGRRPTGLPLRPPLDLISPLPRGDLGDVHRLLKSAAGSASVGYGHRRAFRRDAVGSPQVLDLGELGPRTSRRWAARANLVS